MKKFIRKLHLATLLAELYERPSFWVLFRKLKPAHGKKSFEVYEQLLEQAIREAGNAEALIEFFELRIAAYLKDMDFSDEADTQFNRARLAECLQIKQKIEEIELKIKNQHNNERTHSTT